MKRLLFLLCFLFSFISFTLAKPAFSVKEKQKSKSEKQKSVSQVAKFNQNPIAYNAFGFEKTAYLIIVVGGGWLF